MKQWPFSLTKVVLPVVHVGNATSFRTNVEHALRNVEAAMRGGADGVFLINMDHDNCRLEQLLALHFEVIRRFPDIWVGINPLNRTPVSLAEQSLPLAGLWTDRVCVGLNQLPDRNYVWGRPTYFGGVAFKYQPKPQNLDVEVRLSLGHVDVLTTSGDATGSPPSIQKVQRIRGLVGFESKVALASGISTQNVRDYLPLADAFLVASSLMDEPEELSLAKVRELCFVVHDFAQRMQEDK